MTQLILLTGSNAAKKYFTNAFSALCWPRSWVAHFRYQEQWVDPNLVGLLPDREEASKSPSQGPLIGRRVLTAYMFQMRVRNPATKQLNRQQVALYPFRYGTVVEAYRIGHDIVHFYFEADGCHVLQPAGAAFLDPATTLPGPNIHAAEVDLPIAESQPDGDESAAYRLLDGVLPQHVTYQPDLADLAQTKSYYPVICHLRDLRLVGKRNEVQKPQFEPTTRTSKYELTEGHEYLFDFGFYVPKWSEPPSSGSKVTLDYDAKAFATPANRTLPVESRYDEQAWLVVPGTTDREILRELALKTRVKLPVGTQDEPADLALTFPVSIKQSTWLRLRSGASDLVGAGGLAIGTIALALVAKPPFGLTGEKLLVFAAAGYVLYVVMSALSRLWKP